METKYILSIGLLVLFTLVVCLYYYVEFHEKVLCGLWVADDDFCKEADVDTIMVYFGKPAGMISRTRNCYIVMGDVTNQGFVMKYTPLGGSYSATMDFDVEAIWPESVDIKIDPAAGSLRIYKDEKLYARLYRENMSSDVFSD